MEQAIEMLEVRRDKLKLELESCYVDLSLEAIIKQLKNFADCLDKTGDDDVKVGDKFKNTTFMIG